MGSAVTSQWLCVAVLLAAMAMTMAAAQVPGEEMSALRDLHASTRGDAWRWRSEQQAGARWNFTVDATGAFVHNPCSSNVSDNSGASVSAAWQGVSCSRPPAECSLLACHITSLLLGSYSLSGSIPPAISNLSSLQELDFNNNQLTGPIPSAVGDLTALTHLSLYFNWLTGQIPPEIGQLKALFSIELDVNPLSGTIPPSFGNLSNLAVLFLGDTLVSGTIPDEIGKLTALKILYIYRNRLSGSIPNIGRLLLLEELSLRNNQLGGVIPVSLMNLTALEFLSISSNRLTGTIPSEVNQLSSLKSLFLNTNMLTGSIPDTITLLTTLVQFSISTNMLTKTIPEQMWHLNSLSLFSASSNQLTGTIPNDFGQLSALEDIYLNRNLLTGIIPGELWYLTTIKLLSLHNNQLAGTIPTVVGLLTNLVELALYGNNLDGTIPVEIGRLSTIQILILDSNKLMGSITDSIGNLTALVHLALDNNYLTGTIPGGVMMNLVSLRHLSLNTNQLTGTIPEVFGQLTKLELLYMFDNSLTGTIPAEVGQLKSIELLSLDSNLLTGTVPIEICKLGVLNLLSLHSNKLTGTIPATLGQLSALQLLSLRNNQLTGSIPAVGSLTTLEQLSLNLNHITGTIPSDIGMLESTVELRLQDNFLSGQLPYHMSRLRRLAVLFLQNNCFGGQLDNIFNSSIQLQLSTIDISNNRLEGALASEIFLLPQLRVLSLSVNCFKKELPWSICDAKQVEVLSLNGLLAAEGCRDSVVLPLSGVTLFNTIGGSVPSCIWSLRNLSVLHLTGNGLTGELIPFLPTISQLSDLSLSHNQLGSTIPVDILRIANLDLSYNQFDGEYEYRSQSVLKTILNLEINRLSGHLPMTGLGNVLNGSMNVLRGNLFSCNSIPVSDELSDDYVCGSRNFNVALYMFVSAVCIVVLIMILASCAGCSVSHQTSWPRLMSILQGRCAMLIRYVSYMYTGDLYLETQNKELCSTLRKIAVLCRSFVGVTRYTLQLMVVVLVGSTALYLTKGLDLEDDYTTHSHTYAWFWTLAYTRGVVPAGLLLLLWTMAISACFCRTVVYPSNAADGSNHSDPVTGSVSEIEIDRRSPLNTIQVVAAFCLNAIVTITVNMLYIYSTQHDLSATVHFGLQLGLSVIRLVYTVIVYPLLSSPIQSPEGSVRFRFMLLTINNLLIPCMVAALTSDSCFQGLLVSADAISTPYSYRTCLEHLTSADFELSECSEYGSVYVASASLVPPFSYSNQCGSVILTAYIPVFLMSYSIQLLLPLVVMAVLINLPYSAVLPLVRMGGHGLIWPEYWLQQGNDVFAHHREMFASNPDAMLKTRTIFCNDVLNNWLVMLTFGLCSPVLAVAITFTVLLKMYFWSMLVGRFTVVCLSFDRGNENKGYKSKHNATSTVEGEAITNNSSPRPFAGGLPSGRNVSEIGFDSAPVVRLLDTLAGVHIPLCKVLAGSFWLLAWCSALFVSFLAWDMAADDVGRLRSLWIPLFPAGFVVLLGCVARYWCCGRSGHDSMTQQQDVSCDREGMSPSVREGTGHASLSPLHVDRGSDT